MAAPRAACLAIALLLSSLPLPLAAGWLGPLPAPHPADRDALQADLRLAGVPAPFLPLLGLRPAAPPLPADPAQALAGEVDGLLADLGLPARHDAAAQAARLDPALAGRAAQALAALRACHGATRAAQALVPPGAVEEAFRGRWDAGLDAFAGIRACALPAAQALVDLEAAALEAAPRAAAAPSLLVDLWPALAVGQAGDDVYANDYALIVELGGDDTYDNNAGSNVVDLRFAPASSPFPGIDPVPHVPGLNDGDDDRSGYGPSEGCAIAVSSLQAGNCTPLAGALVDVAGNDRYGVLKAPLPAIDGRCTADPVVRRMVTNGAALMGFAMLLDSAGADAYTGRAGSDGAGHVGGVGLLVDRAGDDRYLDIRNAQGFSVVGLLGLLLDEGGDDEYARYMPSPLVPGTPDEQDGAGGVVDDTGLCDSKPRLVQGAGFLPGSVGVLVDLGGRDSYDGACITDFGATLLGQGSIGAPVCAQGFGATGGLGVLADLGGGADAYLGVPGRGDGRLLLGAAASAEAAPAPDAILSADAFWDA